MEGKQNITIPLAIIFAGALIAGAIYFGTRSKAPATSQIADSTAPKEFRVDPVGSSDHILGNPDAEITIIEYSDLECPWCKVFHNTMRQIVSDYHGDIAWVYRHLPYHSKAPKEAEAAECAANLGGNDIFWKFIDKVFATTNSNDSLDPAELPKIATSLGLHAVKFNTCLGDGTNTDRVRKYINAAIDSQLGTPYSVIITKRGEQDYINGAQTYATIKSQIDQLLK